VTADAAPVQSKFASRVFLAASIYGAIALLPLYALELQLAQQSATALTRPEFLYGFVGVALAWQAAFYLISRDVVRFRPLMLVAILEKLSFGIPAIILFAQGRLGVDLLAGGLIDLVLAALFALSFRSTVEKKINNRTDKDYYILLL